MLLLQVLSEQEDYGYSIVVRLQDRGFDALAEGTVYPALSRLEAKGLLTSRLEPSRAGPARKYYRPTKSGVDELQRAASAWIVLRANVDRVMTPKPTEPNQSPSNERHEVAR
jgi:PadR family transcriptional regulator, regulatory protein PadR